MTTPALDPGTVFVQHSRLIRGVALRYVGTAADADEVVSDVALLLVRKLHLFRGESELGTWVFRVTTNAALTHLKRRARRAWMELDGEKLVAREDRQPEALPASVTAALTQVHSRYRRVLLRRFLDEATHSELAAEFGLDRTQTANLLKKAMMAVRRELAGHRV